MFVPQKKPYINEKFKSILIPNKLKHVLSLGNIGSVNYMIDLKVFQMSFIQ